MKWFSSLRKTIRGSGSVLSVIIAFATAGLLIALTPVASSAADPSFFQGFEADASNWFPIDFATVERIQSGSTVSTCYNSGSTCFYANGISAATGTWFGLVTAAVSTSGPLGDPAKGSCTIDTSGSIGPSLLCYGPYTFFGLRSLGDTYPVYPFPAGGFTTQVDIYLDVAYAGHHPDCVRGPCTPDTPQPVVLPSSDPDHFNEIGDMNPACATDPNGIDCEGSRFDWTLGVSKSVDADSEPGADFLQDYVFSVGTGPAPPNYGYGNWCDTGWIITAGYNSDRSGGDTYNPGFEPKCLATSGWYTFKQVFKNDGTGNLEVDFFILDSSGNVVACTDRYGNASTCSWVRKPGHATSEVGCPRYGWLANEEINYLPIDNTKLFIDGCGLSPLPRPAQITPTDITCQQYAGNNAPTLDLLQYTLKGGKINSVSPGVFFYYTYVSGTAGQTVEIAETYLPNAPIDIQKSQAVLYSSTCAKLDLLDVTNGNASGTLPSDGLFIVGVKYNASSLKGTTPPSSLPATYMFDTLLDGTSVSHAEIDLNKK